MKKIVKILSFILVFSIIFTNISISKENIKIYAKSYISYERNTKSVLFGKDIDEKIPIASTTKIMTAILLLEYGNLNEYAIASKVAQNTTGQQLNLKEGDNILLNDLLYAIMLYSANDAAVVIAEHIGGSVEGFCEMMNSKAKGIGCSSTNFTSPHGLDDVNHYSTPLDLVIITDYALNIPKFKEITSTKSYIININNSIRNINNTNKLLFEDYGITGTKTGYTNNARYCLVSNKAKDDKDIISVVLGADSSKQRFEESKKILDYSINNYQIIDLKDYIKPEINVIVKKSKKDVYILIPYNIPKICILTKQKDSVKYNYYVLEDIAPPLKNGDILAVCDVLYNNNSSVRIEYKLFEDINKNGVIDYFSNIISNIFEYLRIK